MGEYRLCRIASRVGVPLLMASVVGCSPGTDHDEFLVEWTRDYSNVPIIDNPAAAQLVSATAVGAQPIARIEESSGGDVCSIARVYRLQAGDIVISDSMCGQILVYDSLGRFKRRIGRKGDGPGEYRQLRGIRVLPDDTILIFAMPERLIRLTADGGFVDQQPVPRGVQPIPFGNRDLKTVLAEPVDPARFWYAYEPLRNSGVFVQMAGTPAVTGLSRGRRLYGIVRPGAALAVDTIGWFPDGAVVRDEDNSFHDVQFSPITVTAFGSSYLYIGDGATYEIGQYDLNGRLLRRIRRSTPRAALSSADRRTARERHEGRVSEVRPEPPRPAMRFEIADVFPYFYQLIADDRDYLWVNQTTRMNGATQNWAVFDTMGRLVEDVVLPFPPSHVVRRIDGVSVMVEIRDRMTPELVVYPLSRQGAS